ncbi:MAG: hypothetical protein V4640_11740 [Verrucomicrobiota bacterium]
MDQSQFPSNTATWHDDGIFRYRKPMMHDAFVPMDRMALNLIDAFRERESNWAIEAENLRKEWERLPETERSKPWVTVQPPVRARKAWERLTDIEEKAEEEYMQNLVEMRNRMPGRFRSIWLELTNPKTCYENRTAWEHPVFPLPYEPDYSDLLTAGYYHEEFCWAVALRSAFRALDLLGTQGVEYPRGWVHVRYSPEHSGHTQLLASAFYLVGIYHAKAQAMQRVPLINRAVIMTRPRKGKIDQVGEAIWDACGRMHALGQPLSGKNASQRLLAFLVEEGKAEINPPTIGGKDAPSWKICKHMKEFRDKNGLSIGKTRSAKAAT